MSTLHTLRNAPWLARLALLWFALTLGAAVASPMVNPQSEVLICSAASGMTKVVLNADGTLSSSPMTMDCPLCMLGGASAPVVLNQVAAACPLGRVHHAATENFVAERLAARPPARAPPVFI